MGDPDPVLLIAVPLVRSQEEAAEGAALAELQKAIQAAAEVKEARLQEEVSLLISREPAMLLFIRKTL